jgi:hypothetical protein
MPHSDPVELVDGTLIYYTYAEERFASSDALGDRFNAGYYRPGDRRDDPGRPLLGTSGMPDPKVMIEEYVYYQLRGRELRHKPRF